MTCVQLPSNETVASSLADFLDQMFSDYPVLVHDGSEGRLVASYARVDIDIRVEDGGDRVRKAGATPNRFIAPSLAAAISFIAEVEALRQRSSVPYLQFQTGHGPSPPANAACMCRTAKGCGGAGA